MNLRYLEEIVYDKLFGEIENNLNFYCSNDVHLKDLFPGTTYFGESNLVANLPEIEILNNLSTNEKNQQDLVNTRLIYNALKHLTPLVATNKYLWSYLCHAKYKEYVISRWLKNPEDEDKQEDIIKTIKKRFFCSSFKDLIRMNAISRLWWAGYLTYDENHANPFHLTEILFIGQQICADILDTPFCGNKKIITGILSALKQYMDYTNNNINSDLVRKCIKYFRRYAAVTSVDSLDETEIQGIIYDNLSKN